ncbi:unnamed protein product [Phytophthora lilii]|uniref:beta-glucosidase n=1 Tax=Phytophthora lilii TaxID=2077276 RepID=A0A9W6X2Q5_9STRA|nr:unnamed protein product [Phytophthora lilii]
MLKSWMSAVCYTALSLAVFNGGLAAADEWDAKVDEIMANFTNLDIVGQMTQIAGYGLINSTYQLDEEAVRGFAKYHVGSYLSPPVSNSGEINGSWGWTTAQLRDFVGGIQKIAMEENGGHPMIYGTDSAHGNALVTDTVFFGQEINGAATFNPDLLYEQGRITARDTLAAGIPWIFDPVLDNMHNPLWPRVYETFGEDPYLTSVMGAAIVRGMQSYNQSAACMKHWIAYAWTPTGHDTDDVTISDFDLLLRDDLKFDGMMVTDYAEINDLHTFHRTARSKAEGTKYSLKRTSIDMSMVAGDLSFTNATLALLEEKPEIFERLKESVRRTIKLKLKLGLYDDPMPGEEYLDMVGNEDDVAAALAWKRLLETAPSRDIDDLTLPLGQIEYVKELASTGTKVILVLFEGRPRILNDLPENVYAVLNGMLACERGGKAVAEIIYGDVNPSGRMPITYPKDTGNVMIPYRHRVSTQCATGDYCEPQWTFGHGLSYTNFTYSDMSISTTNVTSSSDSVNVSVTVTNSGSVAGKETVMLFLTQPYRSISVPEVKQLKKFSKISLDAGASQTVTFELTAADWSVYYPQIGQGLKLVAEDADYVVAIKPETDCDVYNETAAANPLCATFTLSTGEYPFGSLIAE